ncbi:MAG: 4Fe-4S dicluster domain-containing protein [Bacteroidales bacterium]|nr:4Fe-4S dicluster domain-containing protein [Bacteroidales bacterium]MBQ1930406.1 4Fe-4S dicluster domain-containing protein [Bacteroidales bacterium]MBQ5784359.1 4Fe-4S dicluster domain-containing protein [Bacteroidales bacterium]MBQ5864712.1 4Fe-4S dicluster domain-containing protein [Bacteroidales bacterium]MBR6541220.1 4Fe-4S dicluster domain-containing protein [Bacteroidales bacterium]
MNKFGFALTPSSRIDLDKFNKEKFALLVKLEPDVLKCMACGSCTASCTAGKFTKTSVRSAILALQNGQEKEALDMVKGCLLCGKCSMVCPRAINTRHLIISICKIYQEK